MNGMLTIQLDEKEAHYLRLQVELVSLRQDLEKLNKELSQYQKFEEHTKDLNEILVK